MSKRRILAFLPLILFAGLAGLFFLQLANGGGSNVVPSALIGQKAPDVSLPQLEGLLVNGQQVAGFSNKQLLGKVSLVNIWASWCGPCRAEHPFLMELAKNDKVQMIGINYKDQPVNALRFLGSLGNPYEIVGADLKGRSSIEWGVYGVPETFIVDHTGVIVHKHVGPLTNSSVTIIMSVLKAAIGKANTASGNNQ
ncbi:MAG: DsbE family thiol:disulfide interchange protein [Hyphomicrobiales bacterium]|nr:MAG: DsbE family thiol:disulfide interchange protein [Hyphomicrobiales bacterium]